MRVGALAARAVMGEPHLGRGEVEPGGEVEQPLMVAGAADPRLMADQVAGEAVVAQFGGGDRGADIGPGGEAAPFLGVERIEMAGRAADAERALREQAVEGLAIAGRGLQPRLDPLRMAAGGVGAGGPIMAGGGELDVGRARGDIAEMVGGGGAIAHPPGGEAGDPIGVQRPFGRPLPRLLRDPARLRSHSR